MATTEVVVVPSTQEQVLTLVASAVEVAIARVDAVDKTHKPTAADRLQGVLDSLKALNLDHKIIK
eukprot:10165464-Heterocapsa_arctica.AAC.1